MPADVKALDALQHPSHILEEQEVLHEEKPAKKKLSEVGAIFACGTALFSDGYQNGVVGSVNTMLKRLYPVAFKKNNYSKLFAAMGFAGTAVGMLVFGYLSDKIGRRFGMFAATIIIFVFTALATGAYGAGGSIDGMFQALIAYRFLTGIGIGAEYPAGSVAASENTEDPAIQKGRQHMWYSLATNSAIDWGFVVSAFVPLVLVWICGENHLSTAWRVSFGIGLIPPALVFVWRLFVTESIRYQTASMRHAPTPYWLILKRYWKSLLGICVAWFLYDFIAYPFGIYSSTIIDIIIGDDPPLWKTFGWNVVINLFYIPGTMGGAVLADYIKPKRLIIIMLLLQAIVGFFMSGFYVQLTHHVAGFCVIYGIFLAFGEAGPGNGTLLIAAKTWPTAFRGQAFGLAAAVGKIGAFAGTYAFPEIIADFPEGPKQSSGPFWIGSGMAVFSAIVIFLTMPEIHADHMVNEDAAFKAYLEENGYDTSLMGLSPLAPVDSELGDEKKEITGEVRLAAD